MGCGVPSLALIHDESSLSNSREGLESAIVYGAMDLRQHIGSSLLLSLVVLTGCNATTRYRPSEEIDPVGMQRFRDLEAMKAQHWVDGFRERTFEFGEHGRVDVTRWELRGTPGDTHVHVEFRWTCTSEKAIRNAFVTLQVFDRDGELYGESKKRLFNPSGYDLYEGDTVVSSLRADTRGVHNAEGWHWGLGCESMVARYPTNRPEIITLRRPGSEEWARRQRQSVRQRYAPLNRGAPGWRRR